MKYSESEKFQLIENQIRGMSLLLKFATVLPCVFGGRNKVKSLKADVLELRAQLHELKHLPDEFNAIFSRFGWIAYDRMSLSFMRSQVELAKNGQLELAILKFHEFYSPEQIEQEIMFLHGVDCARPRMDLIRLCLQDYKESRFHAVVPVLLMIMDGIVNDTVGRGMHSDTQELDAWDSIAAIDNGLKVIHDTFRKGRYKTRTDEISEPFRNGILHGLDLGYANINVAVKCWHYLFVIRDWASSKADEEERIVKFSIEKQPVDIRKLARQIHQTESVKRALSIWAPKHHTKEYLDDLGSHKTLPSSDEPEYVVLQFFKFLNKKNFKDLSELFWEKSYGDKTNRIPRVRNEFKEKSYILRKISKINQDSPVICEISVETNACTLEFRMLYQTHDEGIAMPSLKNGKWAIVWVRETNG